MIVPADAMNICSYTEHIDAVTLQMRRIEQERDACKDFLGLVQRHVRQVRKSGGEGHVYSTRTTRSTIPDPFTVELYLVMRLKN